MNALELIREVEKQGGRVERQGASVVVSCQRTLSPKLLEEIRRQKPAVLVALGAPFDVTIGMVLDQLRKHLPPSMKALSDQQLQVLVNWAIIVAWGKAGQELTVRE
jgi:hypothetical protein